MKDKNDHSKPCSHKEWVEAKAFCPYEKEVSTMEKSKADLFCHMFGTGCPAGERQIRLCNLWLEQGEREQNNDNLS